MNTYVAEIRKFNLNLTFSCSYYFEYVCTYLEFACPRNNQTLLNGPVTLRRQDAELDDTVVLNCIIFIVVKCTLFYTNTQINLHTLIITTIVFMCECEHMDMVLRTHSGKLVETSSLLLLYQSVPVSARQWVPMSPTNFKYIYFQAIYSYPLFDLLSFSPLLSHTHRLAYILSVQRQPHKCIRIIR